MQAQSVLTIGEVFDFNVNDEFHYEKNVFHNGPPSGRVVKITDKTYSVNNDTITYEWEELRFTTTYAQPNTQNYIWNLTPKVTKTTSYYNLSSPITGYNSGFAQDTIQFRTDLSGTLINFFSYCVGTFEPDCFWGFYGEGVGIIDYGDVIPSNQYITGERLTFYKKASKEWGIRWDFPTGVNDLTSDRFIQIFPNPFKNSLTISSSKPTQINIYNLVSELVFSLELIIGETNVDLSRLANGVYIVNSVVEGNNYKQVLIKE